MEQILCNSDWQALRRLVRSGDNLGRKLRMIPSRKTQNGKFLTMLVDAGLIRRSISGPAATPFDAWYSITPEGRVAAEYGFYDGDWSDKLGVCIATKGWMPEDKT